MKRSTYFVTLIFVIVLLAACRTAAEPTPTVSTFEILHLQISPSLQHWLGDIAACAGDIPNFGMTTEILPDDTLDISQADLIVRLGDRRDSDPYVAVLGTEEIVVITSHENNKSSISVESLQAIYGGTITNWSEIPEFAEQNSETSQPITVLSFPEGDVLRNLFTDSFLNGKPILSQVETFSTTEYLSDYLDENPYSIGYALKSQMPQNARPLEITGFDQNSAFQYVLAITSDEPQSNLRQLLLCIQN